MALIYSAIFIIINKFIKSEEIATKTIKSIKSLKEFKEKNEITVGQFHELMNDYKVMIKKEAEIYITSLLLFGFFYYYAVPAIAGSSYVLSFLIISIVFSILISLFLYVFRKIYKKKNISIGA